MYTVPEVPRPRRLAAAWLLPLTLAAIAIAASAFMAWTYRRPWLVCFSLEEECMRSLTGSVSGLALPLGWHLPGIALALLGYCLAARRPGSLGRERLKVALLLAIGGWALWLGWRMDEEIGDGKFVQHLTPEQTPGPAFYLVGALLLALALAIAVARLIYQAATAKAEASPEPPATLGA